MSKAIDQVKDLTVGYMALGLHGSSVGTVKQQVHDGDTINVLAVGNFGVHLLGIDAPEISFTLPEKNASTSLNNVKWEESLKEASSYSYLDQGLSNYLRSKIGIGPASNHYRHADAAQKALELEIANDMKELGLSKEDFQFFMAFAHDIMDRYGRLLGFINKIPAKWKQTFGVQQQTFEGWSRMPLLHLAQSLHFFSATHSISPPFLLTNRLLFSLFSVSTLSRVCHFSLLYTMPIL